ncbi:anaerobic sulfatase maturase [Texcoconibacillus texcoconensis]|uniref:Radical SAM core domain-containing protein n=1 Tax=Texcoconibacillus texcoconensis TaxID=1095777 RepID=A0A840QQU9_9BACI|nr:anaerobic sulfatase maturase [Texcoconibacillus texcoconensis]MBB5173822.1 uncharacterized protein [Texcoconibacillus texcoconensis]
MGNPDIVSVMWKTVSESCNLACDYCYYSDCAGNASAVDRIDDQLLETFIEKYMAMTRGAAVFSWQGGEPLLAGRDFFEKVVHLQAKYAPKNTVISNAIQTNGTLIDDEWAKFFKKYNFLVGVSIDGPKDIHDKRRPTGSGAGSFDRTMAGVDALRRYGVPFNILTVIHEDNVGRAADLLEFYKQERFAHIQFLPCMDFKSQSPGEPGQYLVTPDEYGAFLCEAFDTWYNDGQPLVDIRFFDNILRAYLGMEMESCVQREACPKVLILEQNGDAFPCDFYISDEYKLGNVGVDSLEAILNHPRYDEFLKMKPDLPEACRSCEYLALCNGGCPRNRVGGTERSAMAVDDRDYFCTSFKQLFKHADSRLTKLAALLR